MWRNDPRPDFNWDHGFGLLSKAERVPWVIPNTLSAKTACVMFNRFSSFLISLASFAVSKAVEVSVCLRKESPSEQASDCEDSGGVEDVPGRRIPTPWI